jgi:hypothetical protein
MLLVSCYQPTAKSKHEKMNTLIFLVLLLLQRDNLKRMQSVTRISLLNTRPWLATMELLSLPHSLSIICLFRTRGSFFSWWTRECCCFLFDSCCCWRTMARYSRTCWSRLSRSLNSEQEVEKDERLFCSGGSRKRGRGKKLRIEYNSTALSAYNIGQYRNNCKRI